LRKVDQDGSTIFVDKDIEFVIVAVNEALRGKAEYELHEGGIEGGRVGDFFYLSAAIR